MPNRLPLIFYFLTVSLSVGSCTPLYKTCLLGGCYGPFELVLKTENGEYVEDVVVKLSRTQATSHGGISYYREYALANTGEPVHLPRGFLSKGGGRVQVHISIYHPDYGGGEPRTVENTSGVVDLGTVVIKSAQDELDRTNAMLIEKYRKQGMSEEEINEKMEGKRERIPGAYPSYFAYLTVLGKEDLIEKRLPPILKEIAEYRGYTAEEAIELEVKVRRNIKELAKRL